MKAIASVVRGLEKTLKDHIGGNMLHLYYMYGILIGGLLNLILSTDAPVKVQKQGRNETYKKTTLHLLYMQQV